MKVQIPSLLDAFARHVSSNPGRTAVIRANGRSQTYLQLHAEVTEAGQRLLALGIQPGDRLALLGRNDGSHIVLLLACTQIGAVVVLLNWRLAVDELITMVEDAAPAMLLSAASFDATARAVSLKVEGLSLWVADDDDLTNALCSKTGRMRSVSGAARRQASPPGDLLLCYTSGSSGKPKGVRLTHANLSAACNQALSNTPWRWREGSVALCALPLFHIAGLRAALFPVIFGGTAVFIADTQAATIIRALVQYKIEKLSIVPTVLAAILADPAFKREHLDALETVFYGGAPMPETLLKEVREQLPCDLVQIYGLTETTGAALCLDSADHVAGSARLKSCGKPLPQVLVELRSFSVDEAQAQEGEICLAGGTVTPGYWQKPQETEKAFAGQWFRTGDLGTQDAEGYVSLKGRLGDVIKTGGEKVIPNEVEETLMRHPAVLEAAVVGIPDSQWGEKVVAAIVLRPGMSAGSEALVHYCRQYLAGFKLPKQLIYVSSLPRNANGKLMRAAVRQDGQRSGYGV